MEQLWWRCSANRVPRRESAADSRRSASRSERNSRFFKGLYLQELSTRLLRGTPPEHRRCSVSLDFRFVRPGIETRSLTISARQEPSDKFFCSFLDHPGSHLDQVYDSPPAYFWCANPGMVEGTLAVMVGASCGAMPGRAARCLSSVHGQFCSIRPTWRWLQGILYSMWDRIRYSCVETSCFQRVLVNGFRIPTSYLQAIDELALHRRQERTGQDAHARAWLFQTASREGGPSDL